MKPSQQTQILRKLFFILAREAKPADADIKEIIKETLLFWPSA
jgi:hypothetical protein